MNGFYILFNHTPTVIMKLIVFDTETTGLPETFNTPITETEKWPHIVQLSWIVYDASTHEVLGIQDHIIKCLVDIPLESSNIHGITNSYANRKGIALCDAMDLFDHDLQKADMVVAHNISFDKRVYMVEAIRNNRPHYFVHNGIPKSEFCTMKETKAFCNIEKTSMYWGKYLKYPTLMELHEKLFEVIPKGAHNAMVDVLICIRCYLSYTTQVDVLKQNKTLSKLYQLNCEP